MKPREPLLRFMRFRPGIMLVVTGLCALLPACDDPHTSQVKARLAGTWFSESAGRGEITRRVLTMGEDGRVQETVRVGTSTGASQAHTREGEWSFDGGNFKRKYTRVDGKPLTNAYFIYETYELRSVTDTELVAGSNVGLGELRFQRAGAPPSNP